MLTCLMKGGLNWRMQLDYIYKHSKSNYLLVWLSSFSAFVYMALGLKLVLGDLCRKVTAKIMASKSLEDNLILAETIFSWRLIMKKIP